MNGNSLICRFIEAHPADWEALLTQDYGLKIKKDGCYAIFNYRPECNFADPIVQEARGIIIDVTEAEVACWPFRKFGNHNEFYADSIDWASARVLEKIDGSIIKLWYDLEAKKWQFSTNGTIRAEKAQVDEYEGVYFSSIIARADNYSDIPFGTLDKDNTYIFELVSPETQVVVNYGSASLYHIGTRSNKTGEEYEISIGIKKPSSYPLGSLEDCLRAAAELNRGGTDGIAKEGFVVVDKNWHRVKVKSPDYLAMHRLMQINVLSKRDHIQMILENNPDIGIICDANPHLLPAFKYYEFKLAELKYQADKIGVIARNLYLEYNGDRAAVAKIIMKHKLASIGFLCLDRPKNGSEILVGLPVEKLAKLIPDYEPEDIYSLFLADKNGE